MNYTFPDVVFPEKIKMIIKELKDDMKFPVAYVAGSILFAISVMIGSAKKLTTRLGDTFANIFVVLVGPQGTGKSRPVEWATRWMRKQDIEEINRKLPSLAPGVPMPPCMRYLVNDITPEALSKQLKNNPFGVGQHVDELCKLVADIGRYNNSKNEDMLLTLFSGGGLIVDRKTKDRPIALDKTFYSLIGTVQPKRYVSEFITKRYDSGLYARFLPFCVLDNPPILWQLDDDLPGNANEVFDGILQKIAEEREIESTYALSPEARDHIQIWQNEKEKELASNGREFEVAIFRKFQIYALKLALILQVLWDVCEERDNSTREISQQSAVFATLLTEYCYQESVDLALNNRHETLSTEERRVYDSLPDFFSTKDGLLLAEKNGMSRSAFYGLMAKIKGILVEKKERGSYVKMHTTKSIPDDCARPFS